MTDDIQIEDLNDMRQMNLEIFKHTSKYKDSLFNFFRTNYRNFNIKIGIFS